MTPAAGGSCPAGNELDASGYDASGRVVIARATAASVIENNATWIATKRRGLGDTQCISRQEQRDVVNRSTIALTMARAAGPVSDDRGREREPNWELMERVAIVGPGGAGKSTFARALGERIDLPVVHLDRHFWKPGWVERPRDEWRQRQSELFAGDRWIADGNSGGTFDDRFARADTVIIVARSRLACVASAVGRSVRHHGRAVQADGCPERFEFAFYRWIWNYERDSRPRLDAALRRHGHLHVVELRTRAAIDQFLESSTR